MNFLRTLALLRKTACVFALVITPVAATVSLAQAVESPLEAAMRAEPGVPKQLAQVGITEHLGSVLGLRDFTFQDESGKLVHLQDYFHAGKPVILNLGYYGCPMLCSMVLNGLVDSLKKVDWTPGKEFELVSVSIDPSEDPALASKKKANYLESYGRPAAAFGWHFLTAAKGQAEQVQKLAQAVGFGYAYDAKDKQFAHGAAVMVLTPEGKVSRYLYGIEYPEKDLKLALLEASDGKIGTVVDRLLLFCYRYDPQQRKYSMVASRAVKAGSGGMVVFFGAYLTLFWRRQRREKGV